MIFFDKLVALLPANRVENAVFRIKGYLWGLVYSAKLRRKSSSILDSFVF
jgi:hypothetical protein